MNTTTIPFSQLSALDLETINNLRASNGLAPFAGFEDLEDLERDATTNPPFTPPSVQRNADQLRWEVRVALGEMRCPTRYLEDTWKRRLSDELPEERERREFAERVGLSKPTVQTKPRNPQYAAAEAAAFKVITSVDSIRLDDFVSLLDPASFISQSTKAGLIGKVKVEPWAAFRAISNLGRALLRAWALSDMTLDTAQQVDDFLHGYNAVVPDDYSFEVTTWDREQEAFVPVSVSYLVRNRTPFDRAIGDAAVVETRLR